MKPPIFDGAFVPLFRIPQSVRSAKTLATEGVQKNKLEVSSKGGSNFLLTPVPNLSGQNISNSSVGSIASVQSYSIPAVYSTSF